MFWPFIALAILGGFGVAAFTGAPYLPILKRDYEPLLELSELKAGQHLIDLGSGDGRLLRAAAQRGIRSTGYEINPVMYIVSRIVCWKYRKLVTIHLGDYWHVKLPEADAIYVFLITRFMSRLDAKLSREIKHPTRVISFVFEIPGRKPERTNLNSFVYTYGRHNAQM